MGDGDTGDGDGQNTPKPCDTCEGSPPEGPAEPCADGSTPAPSCVELGDGSCGYVTPECPPSGNGCGTRGAPDCPDGEYCDLAEHCGKGDEGGTCATIPQGCTKEVAPVCGCDGATYDNPCIAAMAGVSVQYEGACGAACSSFGGDTCESGQYCNLSGHCGVLDGPGVCTDIPMSCPFVVDPVCGCDGKTYSNACAAAAEGVSVSSEGECGSTGNPQPCDTCVGPMPGIPTVPCPDGVNTSGPECVQGKDSCEWQIVECPASTAHCREAQPPQLGECWDDSDCDQGMCTGASCCPPNAECILPDMPGHCNG